MAQIRRFFSGANTGKGFYSCFPQVFERKKRVFMIKGGPGVGKSSMMKKIGAHLEDKGLDCCYFPCSSDPDSIDMVSLPEKGFAILDATAPHNYDPTLPGARETMISLGDYFNEEKLQKHQAEIAGITAAISQHFARCYQYLEAAASIKNAVPKGSVQKKESYALVKAIVEKYFPIFEKEGEEIRLFGASYTPKGFISLVEDLPRKNTLYTEIPFGQHADYLLKELKEKAIDRGLTAITLADPLEPQYSAHLYLPQIDFLCTTTKQKIVTETISAASWQRDLPTAQREKELFTEVIKEAILELKTAKNLHDELEIYYTGSMDFQQWEKKLDAILEEIDTKIL